MSRIASRRSPVKPTRRTPRQPAPFGAGLIAFIPFAVSPFGFVEPSEDDRIAAAAMFADEGDESLEARALEAAYLASIDHLQPVPADAIDWDAPLGPVEPACRTIAEWRALGRI